MPNDERRTPRWLFEAIDAKFHFTIDVAATADNALCQRFLTKESNGLSIPWSVDEVVWCNPPYSRGQLVQWVKKAIESPCVTIMLIPGDCSTKASQLALREACTILFLDKRIAFDEEAAGAKFCNWIVAFKERHKHTGLLEDLNLGATVDLIGSGY